VKAEVCLAENFCLDVHKHLVDRGLAVLGMRGGGKSWTTGVIAEELALQKFPFLIVDLMGEYKTLRERFPVLIIALGNPDYADIKNVGVEQAKLLAEKVVHLGISAVLDLKFGTMLERYSFLAAFLEGFYHIEEKLKKPYVLIMDEAHRITPEKGVIKLKEVTRVQQKVEYWVYEIGATGRHYGIGFIAVARRPAEISKMTLSQCELKIVHKVVDPIDLDRLREYGLSNDLIEKVRLFKPGDAVVIGLEEPIMIHVKERLCSHGAETPLAKPVETPDLAKTIKEFVELIKAAPKSAEVKAETSQVMAERFERERKILLTQMEELKKTYEDRIRQLEKEIFELNSRNTELQAEIEELQRKLAEVEETRKEIWEIESKFENAREAIQTLKDVLIEISEIFDLELIPKDIQQIIKERDSLKEELKRYKREEELKRELIEEVINDPSVQSWIRDAKRILYNLKSGRGALSLVFKQAIRMDPEYTFWPEELETGVSQETNLRYCNYLVEKNLLWESRKGNRKAFRNRFKQWIAENIRKIKPIAPDEAIDQIHEQLKHLVLG